MTTAVEVKAEGGDSFTQRLSSYPLVQDSVTKMWEMYQKGRESSRLVKLAGSAAETSVKLAYATAKPIVETLAPVNLANEMGCKSLDRLEQAMPMIKEPSQEVIGAVQTRAGDLYEGVVGARIERARTAAQGVKQYGEDKVAAAKELPAKTFSDLKSYAERHEAAFNRVAEQVHLDTYIEYVDAMIDYLLPLSQAEPAEGASPAKPVYPRDASRVLLGLPRKVGERMLARGDKARAQLSATLAETRERLVELRSTLNLVDLVNRGTSVTSDTVMAGVSQAKETLTSYYTAAMERVPACDTLKNVTNFDGQIVFTMKSLASDVSERFTDLLSASVPDSVRTQILAAKSKAEATVQWADEVTGASSFSSDVVAKMQSNVSFMLEAYSSVMESVLSSKALNWTGLDKFLRRLASKGKNEGNVEPDDEEEGSDSDDDDMDVTSGSDHLNTTLTSSDGDPNDETQLD